MADAQEHSLSRALGRVALVQMDNRFCTRALDWTLSLDVLRAAWFWWKSVEINALWAEHHGYDHFVFCSRKCAATARNGSMVPRAPSWCKLHAVATIVIAQAHDTVVFIDSDAYIRETSLSLPMIIEPYIWRGDGLDQKRAGDLQPSLFFACNTPFVRGWPARPRMGSALTVDIERQLVRRGPPNTGLWLARSSPSAVHALRTWWRARWQERVIPSWARPARSWDWHVRWQEQGALWDLLLSNESGFVNHARVMGALGSQLPPSGHYHCLQAMQDHVTSSRTTRHSAEPSATNTHGAPRMTDASRSPLRHLDHHHFKWASQRSAHMQADLDAARTLARAGSGVKPGHQGGCVTHLFELRPADQSALDGTDGVFMQGSDFATHFSLPPRRERLLARATCLDAQLAKMPPCVRAGPNTKQCITFDANRAARLEMELLH